ncbi:MAG: ATP-binding cassette domain-containing protein [Chloroflexota bacterium]
MTPDRAPGIVVDGLVKRYRPDAPPAVDGLSFHVLPGEVYGLLGPNGSGKSTTIGVLATLLEPTDGRIAVAGFDVVSQSFEVRRRIGVALQETGVDLRATGQDLLTRHARLLGMSKADATARATQLLAEFDLTDAADKRLKAYSGGMRRRLDLAMALVGRPSVVFLDEPTTGLDPISRSALWERVERLRDEGVTVLLTTQYLEEADALADRIGIVAAGKLRVEGTSDELKRSIGGDVLTVEVAPGREAQAAEVLGGAFEGRGRVTVEVQDGGASVPRVLAQLTGAGIEALGVTFARPTLDDVFRHVVGGHLIEQTGPAEVAA